MSGYDDKVRMLRERIHSLCQEDILVAFSGGVDSSLLLKLACEYAGTGGRKVYALTFETAFHPHQDMEIAEKVAGETGAIHERLKAGGPEALGIADNPPDRCYLCKKELYTLVRKRAEELGISTILEGTNADDLLEYRPGLKAVRELGVISPLAEAGMTKEDVRCLAEELALSVAKRPSAPCLATRFPYGDRLDTEKMRMVEAAEQYLQGLDLYNVRVRVHGEIARIETDPEGFDTLIRDRQVILSRLKELGFLYVTLDLAGFRSGSMDLKLKR